MARDDVPAVFSGIVWKTISYLKFSTNITPRLTSALCANDGDLEGLCRNAVMSQNLINNAIYAVEIQEELLIF